MNAGLITHQAGWESAGRGKTEEAICYEANDPCVNLTVTLFISYLVSIIGYIVVNLHCSN